MNYNEPKFTNDLVILWDMRWYQILFIINLNEFKFNLYKNNLFCILFNSERNMKQWDSL